MARQSLVCVCVQESYFIIAIVVLCLPTLCEVIFHLSHVDYDAINLDSDKQGTPLQKTVWQYPPHRHINTHTGLSTHIQLCDT